MKKTISLLLMLTGITLFSEDSKKAIGLWSINFPAPSKVYGYIFMDNGEFYYCNESEVNISNKYTGSSGDWKIEGNKIYIRIKKDLRWKKDWVVFNGELYYGENNEKIFKERKESVWEEISDFATYGNNVKNKNIDESSIPYNALFRIIVNGKVLDKTQILFKLNDGENNGNKRDYIYKVFNP